jgi:methionyl-tRNA formyltransferase
MDQSLDTGAILAVEETAITGETTGESLHDALAEIGAGLIVKTLDGIADGRVAAVPQPAEGVTYASKLERDEGRLDWAKPGLELERLVRAFSPWPGTWFKHHGERIKVLAAAYEQSGRSEPGKVADGLRVACGEGSLTLIRVQRAGKKPMSGEEFLRGFELPPGSRLD